MSLPRFYARVADAVGSIAALGPDALASHLDGSTVSVHAPAQSADDTTIANAALFAVNLAARLYPRLLLSGPSDWTSAAARLATSINPAAELDVSDAASTAADVFTLDWASDPAHDPTGHIVTVAADGWNAHVDPSDATQYPAHPIAALAAAALGVGEVFRAVFADPLGPRGRRDRQPGGFNLITAADPTPAVPAGTSTLRLPDAHLIGAGAVGQACLLALTSTDVQLTLAVLDPQTVDLSNLQRYVLTTDTDVGATKVQLAERAAADSSVTVVAVPTVWGADSRSGPGTANIVLTALDSAADRIAVAAGLPARAYNAWTQPADIGWSRHERFGVEPCLACLYYPDRPRPNEHELIADALRQPPLRVLSYLVTRTPIGAPLPLVATAVDLPAPPQANEWTQQSLLADLIEAGFLDSAQAPTWTGRQIGQVYHDGICAGGLIRLPGSANGEAALVPLAHQSALAGIMLAATFVASCDEDLLGHRPRCVEARFDSLRGLPQTLTRPRERTAGCLCSDPFYRQVAHPSSQ
jgi:hypothetical protein